MFRFEIDLETDPINPREWDNLTKMVCFHRHYDLPNEINLDDSDCSSWDDVQEAIEAQEDVLLIKPLYMYDHSIQDVATSYQPYWWHANWDAGQIGFVFVTRESQKLMGTPTDRLEDVLEGEVAEFAAYMRGEVYGYQIVDDDGQVHDACYGYYSLEAVKEEAQAAVDLYNKDEQEAEWSKTLEVNHG